METLMIPYRGIMLHVVFPSKEALNYFHSELRITIERCFGIFVRRWGIFWRALSFDVGFVAEIVHACCRLHNFIINKQPDCPIPTNVGVSQADVDENDVLRDERWAAPDDDVDGEEDAEEEAIIDTLIGSNTLRERLERALRENNVRVTRSHNLNNI